MVSLPHFSGNNDEGFKYASAVLSAIPEDIPGIVIDLRGNTGGNMYPMIAAVHRFLANDDNMLRFRTRKRTQWIPLSSAVQMAGVQQQSRIECPVAILTDSLTASSGEATLICFRGLDHVRVFGDPTAGYASANQPFELPGGATLSLLSAAMWHAPEKSSATIPLNRMSGRIRPWRMPWRGSTGSSYQKCNYKKKGICGCRCLCAPQLGCETIQTSLWRRSRYPSRTERFSSASVLATSSRNTTRRFLTW